MGGNKPVNVISQALSIMLYVLPGKEYQVAPSLFYQGNIHDILNVRLPLDHHFVPVLNVVHP